MRLRSVLAPPRLGVGALSVTPPIASGNQPSKLFLLGRVTWPYSGAPKDGVCDEYWNGSAWQLTDTTTLSSTGSVIMASSCYDPVTKRVYMFGDEDASNQCRFFDTVAGTYTSITSLSVGGNDTFACVHSGSSKCFIFGGVTDFTGNFCSAAIQSYPINIGTPSQSFTTQTAVLPAAGIDLFGAVDSSNSDIVYLGGGNRNLGGSPDACATTWLRYNMSTPNTNPTAMTSMPVGLSMAGCVDIGTEIIVIGGFPTGPRGCGSSGVYAYNKSGNSWSSRGTYPTTVAGARATYFNGAIYCAGGLDSLGFDINRHPVNATTAVYKSTDAGANWTLHSNLLTLAWGSSILVAQ